MSRVLRSVEPHHGIGVPEPHGVKMKARVFRDEALRVSDRARRRVKAEYRAPETLNEPEVERDVFACAGTVANPVWSNEVGGDEPTPVLATYLLKRQLSRRVLE